MRLPRSLATLVLSPLLACSSAKPAATDAGALDAGAATVVWFRADAGGASFAHPWPMDLDTDDAGHASFDPLPNPTKNTVVQGIVTLADGRFIGFPTTGAVYFRLTDDLDPITLPSSLGGAMDGGSTLQLIDIDPTSPELGRRFPVQWYYQPTVTPYWTAHTLSVASAPGFPLRGHTRYAAVLTTSVHDVHGAPIGPDTELAAALSGSPASAWSFLMSALASLASEGIPASEIAGLAVFTTQDPSTEFFHTCDAVTAMPAPSVTDISLDTGGPPYEFEGHFGPVPNLQTGASPYSNPGDGDFAYDDAGEPIVQSTQSLRFVLTVPGGPPPDGGFPITIYAHGTGGDATSFVGDGTAGRLASVGLAGLSFDQPFAGERAVTTDTQLEGLQFFNFDNPVALRRNIQVAALNMVSLAQLIPSLVIPADLAPQGVELRFREDTLTSFTHSQGSLGGALWLAASNQDQAALLSGAGGTPISALIQQTPENDSLGALALFLNVPETDTADLGPLSPLFSLLREFTDGASAVNYAGTFFVSPRPGFAPRNVFVTMGIGDTYVGDLEIGSLAVAAQLPEANPVLQPFAPAQVLDLPVVTLPVQGNLAGGEATGVWQQANPPPGDDGHFVVFDDPDLAQRAVQFLANAAAQPVGPQLGP